MDIAFLGHGYSWIYALVNMQHAYMNILPILLFVMRVLMSLHCFCILNRENMNIIYSRAKHDWCREYDDEMRPGGVVIHRPQNVGTLSRSDYLHPLRVWNHLRACLPRYIIYKTDHDHTLYVYTTRWYMDNVLLAQENNRKTSNIDLKPSFVKTIENGTDHERPHKEKDEEGSSGFSLDGSHQVNYLCRGGDSHYVRYRTRKMKIIKYRFTPTQVNLYEKCIKYYNKHNSAVVFVEGPIGTGKTCFAYLLANELKASFVDSFNPTETSDTFDNLYTAAQHSDVHPLVILLDEVDVLLRNIMNEIPSHKHCLTQIRNKTHWNAFLDKIQMGCYPNVILIMCSNITRRDIDQQMDPSLLRDGRVNLHFRMESPSEFLQ